MTVCPQSVNGNLFHSFGPATEYALSSYVFRLATGSSSDWLFKDREITDVCNKNIPVGH